jgi:hypothetical protein
MGACWIDTNVRNPSLQQERYKRTTSCYKHKPVTRTRARCTYRNGHMIKHDVKLLTGAFSKCSPCKNKFVGRADWMTTAVSSVRNMKAQFWNGICALVLNVQGSCVSQPVHSDIDLVEDVQARPEENELGGPHTVHRPRARNSEHIIDERLTACPVGATCKSLISSVIAAISCWIQQDSAPLHLNSRSGSAIQYKPSPAFIMYCSLILAPAISFDARYCNHEEGYSRMSVSLLTRHRIQ